MTSRSRLGYGLSSAAAVVWAFTGPGISYLLTQYHLSTLTISFWRDAFMALACVAVLLVVRPALLRVGWRALRGLAVFGAISIGIYHAMWTWAIQLNGAAVAIVILYTFPTFVTLGAWLLFNEPLRWSQVAALALSLAGCALVVRVYDPAVLRLNWLGTLVGLAAALMQAGYVLYNQRAVHLHNPWTTLTYSMVFGALALLALMLVAAPAQITAVGTAPAPWLILLALALGPTLGGYAIFNIALRHIPGQVASVIVVLEAPIATMIAVVFLHEQLVWPQVVGMALILGSVGLPRLLDRRRSATNEQALVSEVPTF